MGADEFLMSYEWRCARMIALKRHGAKCQCCGATTATGAVLNVDHIKPRRTHPELALDQNNLQVLCAACNHGKGNWDDTDWRRSEPAKREGPSDRALAWRRELEELKDLIRSSTNA
jgi:5-methylcytosine-specific restriction endonuclease McrA